MQVEVAIYRDPPLPNFSRRLVMGNVRRQCRRHQELLFLALNEAQISDPHVHSPFYIQLECTCELYWLYTYP